MMNYRVLWEIDIDADSPREAAEGALQIQRRPDSIATVFTVRDDLANRLKSIWTNIRAPHTILSGGGETQ